MPKLFEMMKSKMKKKISKGRRALMRRRKISHGADVPAKPRVEGQSFVFIGGIFNWRISEFQLFWVKLNCVGCGHGSRIIEWS